MRHLPTDSFAAGTNAGEFNEEDRQTVNSAASDLPGPETGCIILPDSLMALADDSGCIYFARGRGITGIGTIISPYREDERRATNFSEEPESVFGDENGKIIRRAILNVLETNLPGTVEITQGAKHFRCMLDITDDHRRSGHTAVMLNLHNNTAEKQAADRLLHSENMLNLVVQESPDVLILRRPLAPVSITCNLKALEFFEADSMEQLLNTNVQDLYVNPPSDALRQTMIKATAEHNEFNMEAEYKTFKGNVRWGAMNVKKLFIDGQDHLLVRVTDITAQREDRIRLQESEHRYRDLFANNPQPMWIFNTENLAFLDVNDAAIQLYGYSRNEFMSMNIENIRPESERDKLRDRIKSLTPNEKSHLAWKHLKKNGDVLEVEVYSHELPPEPNGPTARLAMITDMTQRLKAERERENYRSYLRRIIDTDPNLIFVKNADGRYELVNKAMAETLGGTPESIEGSYEQVFIKNKEALREYLDTDKYVLETRETHIREEMYVNPETGAEHHLLTTKCPVTGPDGSMDVLGVCVDITHRIQAERRLRESRQLLEAVFNNSADALFLVDGETRRITNCNLQAVMMFGVRSKGDYIGMGTPEFRTIMGLDHLMAEMEAELRQQKVWFVEKEYETRSGKKFWGSTAVSTIDILNRSFLLMRISDVSERRKNEEQIKTSLHEKEILIKEIHHRVKNNMAVISGLLHLQSNYLSDPDTIAIFRESQNRIKGMALIHEQLYQGSSFSTIDFGKYLDSLIAHIARSYLSKGQVSLSLKAENASLNLTDAVPCGLIVNELISNSCKHAFPEGTKGHIVVSFSKVDNICTLSVSDNGAGLPDSAMPGARAPGVSLGMTLVYELSKQIRAGLEIVAYKGTTYTLTFKEKL
ncbi:MAG: PAS domain S-box protein [Bacteroidota bacterium]